MKIREYFPVIKSVCFEKVGFLYEGFKHYFADPDYGYRIQEKGYKNIYCPTSLFFHYDLSKKNPALFQERFKIDGTLFKEKWGLNIRII